MGESESLRKPSPVPTDSAPASLSSHRHTVRGRHNSSAHTLLATGPAEFPLCLPQNGPTPRWAATTLTPVPQSPPPPPPAGSPSTLTYTLALRHEWPSPTPSARTNQGEGATRDKHKDRHPQTPRRQTEGRCTRPGPGWEADTLLRLTIQPPQPDLQPQKPATQKGLIPLGPKPRPLHPGTPGKDKLRLLHPGSGL